MSINCTHFDCRHSYECKKDVYDVDRLMRMHYDRLFDMMDQERHPNAYIKDLQDEGILFDEC